MMETKLMVMQDISAGVFSSQRWLEMCNFDNNVLEMLLRL